MLIKVNEEESSEIVQFSHVDLTLIDFQGSVGL